MGTKPNITITKSKEHMDAVRRENGKKAAVKNCTLAYPKSDPVVMESDLADMYADIYDPRAKIDPEMKIHAAMCFMMAGTVTGCANLCGIDSRTISNWKNKSQWWDAVLAKVRKEKQDELDAALSEVIHTSVDALKDRLKDGDEVVTKDGIVRKQVGGRDLATILSTLYDKRSMVRGDPTSITRKETSADVLSNIRDEMEKIADARFNVKVINE